MKGTDKTLARWRRYDCDNKRYVISNNNYAMALILRTLIQTLDEREDESTKNRVEYYDTNQIRAHRHQA
jgi:hypothetical protein